MADIGTFAVPLSMYLFIETLIKWVHRTSYDKDSVVWKGFILKLLLFEEMFLPQNASKMLVFVKTFPRGVESLKARIFMNSL